MLCVQCFILHDNHTWTIESVNVTPIKGDSLDETLHVAREAMRRSISTSSIVGPIYGFADLLPEATDPNEHRVTWEIDVDATSPEQAACVAHRFMREQAAPVFDVRTPAGTTVQIDCENLDLG